MPKSEGQIDSSMLTEVLVAILDIAIFIVQATFLLTSQTLSSVFSIFISEKTGKDVRGKLALITGSGGGLGREIALKLADLGCSIAIVDINEAAAKSVAEEIKLKGVNANSYKADISKKDEVKKLREDVLRDMGTVDILVSNAGLIPDQSENEVEEDFLKAMIEVNVLGTILMTKTFLEQMKQNAGGHLVAISSMSAIHPSPFGVEYSATKAAVNCYMKALGEKLRLQKVDGTIKTTCVCPFYITTRKDVIEFLNPKIRSRPLNVDEAAQATVKAILHNDSLATIPSYFKCICNVVNFLPLCVQQLWRDRILREFDFKHPSKQSSRFE